TSTTTTKSSSLLYLATPRLPSSAERDDDGHRPGDAPVSVFKTYRTQSQRSFLEKEIFILKDLPRHANVLRLVSVVLDLPASPLFVELEHCDAGDLRIFSQQSRVLATKGDWIWDVFTQLLRGLVHLNEFRVLHRNIRPSSCLL